LRERKLRMKSQSEAAEGRRLEEGERLSRTLIVKEAQVVYNVYGGLKRCEKSARGAWRGDEGVEGERAMT